MRIFAAIERILLDRWRKIKIALKINKWPLLSLQEQQLQLKKQYLESLFRKKWHNFVCPIYDVYRSQFPHMGLVIIQRLSLSETHDSLETRSNKDVVQGRRRIRLVKCGLPFTLIRNMVAIWDLSSSICRHLFASQYQTVSSRIRLRLTIMCDSNKMYWIAKISCPSQNRLL